MDENSTTNHEVVLDVNKDVSRTTEDSRSCLNVSFLQKLVAEVVGTYFLIFAGCAAVVVNKNNDNVVTLPGISIVWGLVVMVLVYSVGHISGAHFNPAVTIAFASTKRFPWKQVPVYVVAQVVGSTLASGTLRLIFSGNENQFSGTLPSGTHAQAFAVEFIITFFLMFVISGVATDNRAIGELAGIAVGATVLLNVLFAGYYCISYPKLIEYYYAHTLKKMLYSAKYVTPFGSKVKVKTDHRSINEPSKKLRPCISAQ
ncbi:nodulin-26 isoform X2 [Vigna angularis]|uniref:nodulin-26 isoform X2 n=1 Tax=Phaseolus angularis TaxID=3914 RepID=UPI0022B587A8|nr:nodulin-26 isoform X2 [Vigna angularis]